MSRFSPLMQTSFIDLSIVDIKDRTWNFGSSTDPSGDVTRSIFYKRHIELFLMAVAYSYAHHQPPEPSKYYNTGTTIVVKNGLQRRTLLQYCKVRYPALQPEPFLTQQEIHAAGLQVCLALQW